MLLGGHVLLLYHSSTNDSKISVIQDEAHGEWTPKNILLQWRQAFSACSKTFPLSFGGLNTMPP